MTREDALDFQYRQKNRGIVIRLVDRTLQRQISDYSKSPYGFVYGGISKLRDGRFGEYH